MFKSIIRIGIQATSDKLVPSDHFICLLICVHSLSAPKQATYYEKHMDPCDSALFHFSKTRRKK